MARKTDRQMADNGTAGRTRAVLCARLLKAHPNRPCKVSVRREASQSTCRYRLV